MVSIPKVVGVLSCGFLLCLGLSHAAQAELAPGASDVMKTDSQSDRQGFQSDDDRQRNVDDKKGSNRAEGAKTIKGEVLRVEGDNYFVKGQDGKEVRLQTDQTTEKIGSVKQGDRIEAKMNDENHAISIRSARGTDAGNGNETGRDSLHGTDAEHGNAAGRTTHSSSESGKGGSKGQ